MFVLGVMVGRENAPVTFETKAFQDRLKAIAREYGGQEQVEQEVELRFYDVLNQPVVQNAGVRGNKNGEILTVKHPSPLEKNAGIEAVERVPVKLGKKMMTKNKEVKKPFNYTIQLAAYNASEDAASHIAALKKKGVSAYRVTGEKNGSPLYRVRTGAFPDYNTALLELEKLKAEQIDGMVIKKE